MRFADRLKHRVSLSDESSPHQSLQGFSNTPGTPAGFDELNTSDLSKRYIELEQKQNTIQKEISMLKRSLSGINDNFELRRPTGKKEFCPRSE